MPEQSTSSPMLAIKAAIPKRMLDMVCFLHVSLPLRHLPDCCMVPASVLDWVSLGQTNGIGSGNPRNPFLAVPPARLRRCRVSRCKKQRGSRPAQSRNCTHSDTQPARSATAQVAVASRPLHLSEGTPRGSQVLDVSGRPRERRLMPLPDPAVVRPDRTRTTAVRVRSTAQHSLAS